MTLSSSALVPQAAPSPPNIVFILADDMGYGDLSCFGHPTIDTPNLDRMAREGAHLANAFVSAEEYGRLLMARFQNDSDALEPGRAFYIRGGYANIANHPSAL